MKNIDIDILIGQKFYNDGEYEKCIKRLSQKKFQNNEEILLLIAVSYKILQKYDKALNILAYIVGINFQYIPAYIQQAYIYKEKQLYVDEIELLLKLVDLIKLQQRNKQIHYIEKLAEIYSMLGSAYVKIGNSKKACYCFLESSGLEINNMLKIQEYSNSLFTANYIENISNKVLYNLHIKYQNFFSNVVKYDKYYINNYTGKLRIGYISPDFHYHPVMAWALSFLQAFDSNKFEIYCYSTGSEDELTDKLKKIPDIKWRNVWKDTIEKTVDIIHKDGLNILFDLSGHTANNCLPILAYKPAPVQISGIGYFNTTGLKTVDYFLSDKYCLLNRQSTGFQEKVICMPKSHICYTPLQKMPEVGKSPFFTNNYITFGCFNNFNKVNKFILEMWAKILQEMPTAKLILKSQLFNSEQGVKYVKNLLEQYNLSVERIELREFTTDYLVEYNDIDIALDTYPYTGGVTTCEALYMGVPVITLCGSRHGSRFGYSILKNINLEKCIAYSQEEYISKAMDLANDIDCLRHLRERLRCEMKQSPLMNSKQYMENIERFYQQIWFEYQQNNRKI